MPKAVKKKKNSSKGGILQKAKPFNVADDEGQEYGITTKILGDRHFTVCCQDGKERRCKVRGKMKNRQWVKEGDVVLITTRDFEDDEGDIIDVYSADNVKILRKNGLLTLATNQEGEIGQSSNLSAENDIVFDFDEI